MRCKICGAKLKREGDICKNCYKEYKEKEALYADNEESVFEIKRKYSPLFSLLNSFEIFLILVLMSLSAFTKFGNILGVLVTILCLIIFGVWIFYNKRRAMGTKTIFYQTKFRYIAKYPFVNREEVIAYDDVKEMAYFQSFWQKRFKYADIRFYTKGILSGLTIKDIPNIKENFVRMQTIIVNGKSNEKDDKNSEERM